MGAVWEAVWWEAVVGGLVGLCGRPGKRLRWGLWWEAVVGGLVGAVWEAWWGGGCMTGLTKPTISRS